MKFVKNMLIIILILMMSGFGVLAYDYPDAFWDLDKKYDAAISNKNYRDIINYGEQTLQLMKNEPDCNETRQIKASRYSEVAKAYLNLLDYENSKKYFDLLYDIVNKYPAELAGFAEIATKAKQQFTAQFKLYTSGGESVYYGAKNEKENGILFGTNYDGKTRAAGELKNESMVIIYQEFGQNLTNYNKTAVKKAAQSGLAIEFALNCPKGTQDIKNIDNMDSYLKEISELFAKYPDTPVYLRFAAEFNNWASGVPQPDDFIYAFRHVSDYFKKKNSQIAMVWSPNQVSAYQVYMDDYYPGDKYVDWVGMSSYAQPYNFVPGGELEENKLWFKVGNFSNPVITVKDIVEKYGDRKPIMLSESGSAHHAYGDKDVDTTDFALQRLQEYYCYLPMIYPQIKLMAHFDNKVAADTHNFSLSGNVEVKEKYLNLTKGRRFIPNGYKGETSYNYKEITKDLYMQSIFEVSSYAYVFGKSVESVTYFLDGKYVGMSNEMPFTSMIDATAYPGKRTLRAVAKLTDGTTYTTETPINIGNSGGDIAVQVSGEELVFDQQPVIYNNRTMVPMRKIFEELGAAVSWDGDSQTATGKRGNKTVKVTIGSNVMYVNDKVITLDTAPIILSGRTLVPVRAVAEGFGCEVGWNDRYRTVSITPRVYSVTFDALGGKGTVTKEYDYDELINPVKVTRDYYTFRGWYKDIVCTQAWDFDKDTVQDDTVLYAKWEENPVSIWVDARMVPDDAEIVDRKWIYTVRKEKTSDSPTMSGYKLYDSDWEWSSWSGWDDQHPGDKDEREIESKTEHMGYNTKTQWLYSRYYGYSESKGYYLACAYASGICLKYEDTGWLNYRLDWEANHNFAGNTYPAYGYAQVNGRKVFWYNEESRQVEDTNSPITKTYWRYRDKIYTYYFYKEVEKTSSYEPYGNDISNVEEYVKYRNK